jgi:hypothetical protein
MYYKKITNGKYEFMISVNEHAKMERRIGGKSTHNVKIDCLNATAEQYNSEIGSTELDKFIEVDALVWIEQQVKVLERRGKSEIAIKLIDAGFTTDF